MRSLLLFLLNNVVVNRFLIWVGKDNFIKKFKANWGKTTIDSSKSLQENVGFSHDPVVDEAISKVHSEIQSTFSEHCPETGSVLDIGCGVGLYLKDFDEKIPISGTDLSGSFIEKAKELLPRGTFHTGDYLELKLDQQFNLIMTISMIEYVPPSKLSHFLKKIWNELSDQGILFIQYPHAMDNWQCLYPDLSYVQYSPLVIQKKAEAAGFKTISHHHSYDGRALTSKFDDVRYDKEKEKSFRNGAIYIGRKA